MKRIVILISGRGSNMEAIAQRCAQERWPAHVVAVISNRPQAAGLQFARARGIDTAVVDHQRFSTRESFDAALSEAIDAQRPDLVLLAGFMRILGDNFVRRYEGRMLNIHPSLLPAFPGLHPQRQALAAGVRFSGCTVHFVRAEIDTGPIIAQAVVPVHPDDDEARLSARILAAEHRLYPLAVRLFAEGRLTIRDGGVIVAGAAAPDGVRLNPPEALASRGG
jgi:phosphoribosylglycinamide formyltransferase-1